MLSEEQEIEVVVRSAGGDERRRFRGDQRLIDLCRNLRVPPNAISTFVEGPRGTRHIVGLYHSASSFIERDGESIVFQLDRNLNYFSLISDSLLCDDAPSPDAAAEYSFSSGASGHISHAYLTAESCRAFVTEAVRDFLDGHSYAIPEGGSVVVGISGGGDSNAMLTALADAVSDRNVHLFPTILLGVREWDQGLPRAEAICSELGLPLQVVESAEVNRFLGRAGDRLDWVGDFHRHFPHDDAEVVGTLAIRLALSHFARRHRAPSVVTGLNLEGILAECFLRLMQGAQPLEFPVRTLDGIKFCFPVYRVPKKILDGCHPKFARENHAERSIGIMMGRAIPYYLAQSVNSLIPGIEFDLIEGFRSLHHVQPRECAALGFSTADEVSFELRERWERYLSGADSEDTRP